MRIYYATTSHGPHDERQRFSLNKHINDIVLKTDSVSGKGEQKTNANQKASDYEAHRLYLDKYKYILRFTFFVIRS